MARIYSKPSALVAKKLPSSESRFGSSSSNLPGGKAGKQKTDSKFNWELTGVIILLLIFVALPICISVWDIGAPIKGYNI